tara:strand:+ start:2976 stop:4097 length:1122 start_codon:yes stop_codon:yes gene_type:complete
LQKVNFGNFDVKKLERFLLKKSCKNLLLVHGKTSYFRCGIKSKIDCLNNQFSLTTFSDFSSNPKIDDLKKCLDLINSKKIDAIISIGGGTSIDIAKLIKGLSNRKLSLISSIKKNIYSKNNIPLIVIPTTAGSGSESTHFAVLYIKNKKYSFAHNDLLPNLVFLDSNLINSSSNYIKVCSGLDALCQAIESHWSINSSMKSKKYSLAAMNKLIKNLIDFIKNPNENNRNEVMKASNLSGKAINYTKTTAPHAFSYYLTYNYKIPHGHAVAILMPYFMEYNFNFNNSNLLIDKKKLNDSFNDIFNSFDVDNISDLVISYKKLLKDLKLDFIDFKNNFNPNDLNDFSKNINLERLKNNPVKVNMKHFVSNFLNSL